MTNVTFGHELPHIAQPEYPQPVMAQLKLPPFHEPEHEKLPGTSSVSPVTVIANVTPLDTPERDPGGWASPHAQPPLRIWTTVHWYVPAAAPLVAAS